MAVSTFSPAVTTISPPATFTNSATHGGELIRGFGHASQYTRSRFFPPCVFFAIAANPRRIFPITRSAALEPLTIFVH